jgi:hypothetical protein
VDSTVWGKFGAFASVKSKLTLEGVLLRACAKDARGSTRPRCGAFTGLAEVGDDSDAAVKCNALRGSGEEGGRDERGAGARKARCGDVSDCPSSTPPMPTSRDCDSLMTI